jgi:membrane-associated phospholipid phosphatase
MAQEQSEPAPLKRAVASLLVFLAATVIALRPDWLDRPLARTINGAVSRWEDADRLAFALASPTFQTVSVVFLLWLCWRAEPNAQARARLASGAIAAVLAAMAAHLANLALPTPPKPIFDPAIDLHPLPVLGDIAVLKATSFVASHSFPSARATLFAGLAIAIVLVRSRLGAIALGCTLLTELSRVALGLHYPADIAGSFALAAAFAQLTQLRASAPIGLWFVRWERRSAPTFYAFGLLACYELAGGFQELRDLAAQWPW